jgi:hypothetical protein
LSDQILLDLSFQKDEIDFLIQELVQAFVRWHETFAIWAIGKAPLSSAVSSILRLFRDEERLFDEEALWQAGCVIEVGLEAGIISADLSEVFQQFLRRTTEAGSPRTQKMSQRMRSKLAKADPGERA